MSARHRLLCCLPLLACVWACTPSEEPAAAPQQPAAAPVLKPVADHPEVDGLRAEVARLRAENADLRASPGALAAEVDAAIKAQDAAKAKAALQRLVERYPFSVEAREGARRTDAFAAKQRVAQEESRRMAALGFKALKVTPTFMHAETSVGLVTTTLARRWSFDSHGDGWRFLDAEKGSKYLIARINVSSKNKNPPLFGLAAYVADGAAMKQVGSLRYKFVRWRDFGAFLGNHADFRNDFSHSARIPFAAAVAVTDEQLKRRPIYLVITREGCHRRHYERFAQPPIFYLSAPCASLKPVLTLDDFRDGSLAVLRRID